jgi:dienelactone hydrolase
MLAGMKQQPVLPAFCLLAAVALAAEEPPAGDQLLADYFRAETAMLAERCLTDVKSLTDWESRRAEYRRQLQEMLGLWPMPERTELKPVITGCLTNDEFTVEKLSFQASPHLYCTASLFLPRNLTQPAPAVLYECGHWRLVTNGVSLGNKAVYQADGAWYARNGYVCLVLDTVLAGEIQGIHAGTRDLGLWWWNSRGYTPAGVEAWFGIRALDYLCTRPEVDTNRFGITGHSGGGAYSWTITALDDRIKAAAPLAGLGDVQCHLGVMDSHCDCNFFVNYYRWDFPQLAALAAPRPLLIGGTDSDRLFPLDNTQRIHEKLRRIYDELYGATNKLGLVLAPGSHDETPELRLGVMRWFNRFLKGEEVPVDTVAQPFFDPFDLKVFDTLPTDAINTNIADTFVPVAKPAPAPATAEERKQRHNELLTALREKTFGGWPANPAREQEGGIRLNVYSFESQPLVEGRLYVLRLSKFKRPERVVLSVLDAEGWTDFVARMPWPVDGGASAPDKAEMKSRLENLRRELEMEKAAVAYFAPRGVGPTAWTTAGKRDSQVRRRFMLLGQTLDGMRVWDIRRAVQALQTVPGLGKGTVTIRAVGKMGVNALYAALFEPAVTRLDLSALPKSHLQGPDYLGVMRFTDIPQTLEIAEEKSEMTSPVENWISELYGSRVVVETLSPVSLAMARTNCPIPLPDSATRIQYAAWSQGVGYEVYVRFEAPISDCLEHATNVLQPYAKQSGSSIVSWAAASPPEDFPKSEAFDLQWFDISRFARGVVFSLGNHWGPVVWVDTSRQCFYFIDTD